MSRDRAGSVLVEALIATAIVATILVGAFGVITDSIARNSRVEARRTALMIARSQMTTVGLSTPLTEGAITGVEDGGYTRRTDVSRCADAMAERGAAGDLYCVAVTVRAPGAARPTITLLSRRLKPGA
uniref:Type II secretion system protein n=1 Tax=Caulobacter sp. (strain K31) TaxID=366602 RepID=B0T7N3_CAUSK